MTRSVALACSLVPLFAGAQELPADAKKTKTQSSASGEYGIRFVELSKGNCRVEVVKDTTVVWTLPRCVGTLDDLYFVSDDGSRFWVLRALPQKPGKMKSKGRAWLKATVAVLYDKDGNVRRGRRLTDLVPKKFWGEVRETEAHVKWLEGVFGVPGKPPRITDANQLELETVGGKTAHLAF